jgi:hypothetical protein
LLCERLGGGCDEEHEANRAHDGSAEGVEIH